MSEDVFDERFRDLFTIAHRVGRRITGDPAAAEDIAAETLSRAYADWPRLRSAPYLEAWVARVATNLALNAVRRRPGRDEVRRGTPTEDQVADHLDLADALRRLPHRQREVLVFRHILGYSEIELAEHLGLGLGTVKTHLRRGYGAMRMHLSHPTPEHDADG